MGAEIERLPIKDYSKNPRRVFPFRGEKSAIRLIDPEDRIDMGRYRDIARSLPITDFGPFEENDQDLLNEVRNGRSGIPMQEEAEYLFGVVGLHGVSQHEIGELQGWVCVARLWVEEIDRLVEKNIFPPVKEDTIVLGVTYARHKDAPVGQMASALRQTCSLLSGVCACQNPEGVKPEMLVLAFVRPRNIQSQNVLKASGFVRKGKGYFYGFETQHLVYALDWNELNTIMQEKVDRELFGERR